MSISKELIWLAGLLEGEGNFHVHGVGSPQICLSMADRDVVLRVSKIFQTRIGIDHGSRKTPLHRTYAYGARAAAIMMSIYPEMGQRRQERIKQILEIWKTPRKRRRASTSK